jgi:hypothetical protein
VRALDDPVKLAKAAQIMRLALERDRRRRDEERAHAEVESWPFPPNVGASD